MDNYVVLYRDEKIMSLLDEPFGFQCFAEDIDHAGEQCLDAYPNVDIVWVWQGEYGIGMDEALNDYYNNGLNDYYNKGETK